MDFSHLPHEIWTKIMSYLDYSDRLSTAVTCDYLYNIFKDPCLWHELCIFLCDDMNFSKSNLKFLDPDRVVKMVNIYGQYVKKLTLFYLKSSRDHVCCNVLNSIASKCNLQEIIIDFECNQKDFHYLYNDRYYQPIVKPIIKIIENSSKLESFSIKSWYYEIMPLLNALAYNRDNRSLKKINFLWSSAFIADWIPLTPTNLVPIEANFLIKKFNFIQIIGLRSTMLSEELIFTLAGSSHYHIKKLNVLVVYSNTKFPLPSISRDAWCKLTFEKPQVRIEFTFMNRIPYEELNSFLICEIPIQTLIFMKFAILSSSLLNVIADNYHDTLEKFVCLSEPCYQDAFLINFVQKCYNLNTFIYHGNLAADTVMKIAAHTKNRLINFIIHEDKIHTIDEHLTALDDDVVVSQNDVGACCLPKFLSYHYEESAIGRSQTIVNLNNKVSDLIGYRWSASQEDKRGDNMIENGRIEYSISKFIHTIGWHWL